MNTNNIISIAPMVDKTDKNFRNFVRMINKDVLLYTEMVTAKAIIHGDANHLLSFDKIEHPISLQIAANNKMEAYEAVKIAEEYDYDEINLNVGCPSDRISGNTMGAYLMAFPNIVAEMINEMQKATNKPISIKQRIGIDGKGILPDNFERTLLDKYEDMEQFVNIVKQTGIMKFIIHARIAILKGLDPKQNRDIPPIRYEDVYRIKRENPNLHIEINGGIKTTDEIDEHLKYIDSVMLGRVIYDNPMILTKFGKYYNNENILSRKDIVEKMFPYLEKMTEKGTPLHKFLRHTQGLFFNEKGSKFWKREISNPHITLSEVINIYNKL